MDRATRTAGRGKKFGGKQKKKTKNGGDWGLHRKPDEEPRREKDIATILNVFLFVYTYTRRGFLGF